MEKERIVLIDGRFELLNGRGRIDIFDIQNLRRDKNGNVNPVAFIALDMVVTDLEAGRLALEWLRDSKYLDQSEFFHFLDIFLAGQPADQTAADKETRRNEAGRFSRSRD
jgi:hypothetical protein